MAKNRQIDRVAVLRGALASLLEQAYQMRGMFDDSDGAIARAIDDAQDALYATAGQPPATGKTDGALCPACGGNNMGAPCARQATAAEDCAYPGCACEEPWDCDRPNALGASAEHARVAPESALARADLGELESRHSGAMVAALTALCETIEATGGLVRDDSGLLVPAGDEEWNDLGDAYLLACRALGREPMIDAEEN